VPELFHTPIAFFQFFLLFKKKFPRHQSTFKEESRSYIKDTEYRKKTKKSDKIMSSRSYHKKNPLHFLLHAITRGMLKVVFLKGPEYLV